MKTLNRTAFTISDLLGICVAIAIVIAMVHLLFACDHPAASGSDGPATSGNGEDARQAATSGVDSSQSPAANGLNEQNFRLRSQSNLRQLAAASAMYAAEWNDNQFVVLPHNLSRHGDSLEAALEDYTKTQGAPLYIGLGWNEQDGHVALRLESSRQRRWLAPVTFDDNPVGSFRMLNMGGFNSYLSGRFYDAVFYAPADGVVLEALGDRLDAPQLRPSDATDGDQLIWSSYCFSPAALYSPRVFSSGFVDPWSDPGGLRAPTLSQSRYPDLKSHIAEHHWLYGIAENRIIEGFDNSRYPAGEPRYFNHAAASAPYVAFFDGHVGSISMRDAVQDDAHVRRQSGGGPGLWLPSPGGAVNGYHEQHGVDGFKASPHIFTRDGILGRDVLTRRGNANAEQSGSR